MSNRRNGHRQILSMEVVVGTYNQVLFGFLLTTSSAAGDGEEVWEFKPLFTDKGHTGCIKSVAIGGRYLASGSTDETIRLFDLKKNVELGELIEQSGSITCLQFYDGTNMLSASEDGTICIWECKKWECLKTLKGHRGPVYSVSIHPSGRLALSVSKDKTVRTWNLLTGRTAYVTNIRKVSEIVSWSPSGDVYAVASGSEVFVYKLSEASSGCSVDYQKTVLAMAFLNESVLVISGESGEVVFFRVQEEKIVGRFKAHDIRIKGLAMIHNPQKEEQTILFTVASDGSLKAWLLNPNELSQEPTNLAEIVIPGRPTCLAVQPPVRKATGEKEEKPAEETSMVTGDQKEADASKTRDAKKKKDGAKKKTKKRKRLASSGSNG